MECLEAQQTVALTESQAYAKVAEKTELKPKDVKAVITSYMELTASDLKKNGKFKLGGMLNLKLENNPAKAACNNVNRFTKSHACSRPSLQARLCVPCQRRSSSIW